MDWKGYERKQAWWPNLSYHPGIRQEGLRRNTKNVSQDTDILGRDLNQGHPEYERRVPASRPQRSARNYTEEIEARSID
jgi:hypothetical protein